MTLRDDLAAVLGPGNDDATAYAQADSVLEVLRAHVDRIWTGDMHATRVLDQLCDDLESPDMKWRRT